MKNSVGPTGPDFKHFKSVKPQAVKVSATELIKRSCLDGSNFLVIEPAIEGVNLIIWAEEHRTEIEEALLSNGAILFRGLHGEDVHEFHDFARTIAPELLDYKERSSPRSEIARGIYTSTDYPSDQNIEFHNEQSYSQSWPMKLFFYCSQPAIRGGATLIADARKVLELLDAAIKEKFLSRRVRYVRNYIEGLGLTWQEAFQTSDKDKVDRYCRESMIDFEWKERDSLKTSQVFDTIVAHPRTGELVWFEHAAFFHVSSLAPHLQEMLMKSYEVEDLPFNTYYGDGTPIESSTLDQIRRVYRHLTVRVPWQKGDVLLLDNMLTSHGRESFDGPRKVLVAMADLYLKSSM